MSKNDTGINIYMLNDYYVAWANTAMLYNTTSWSVNTHRIIVHSVYSKTLNICGINIWRFDVKGL